VEKEVQTMHRSVIPLALAVVTVLLVGGCRKKAPQTEPPPPTAWDSSKWPIYEDTAAGMAIALPKEWVAFHLSPELIDKDLADAFTRFPHLKSTEAELREMAGKGMTFMAIDQFSVPSGFLTNLSIGKAKDRGPPSLEEAIAEVEEEYRALPQVHGPVTHRLLKLPAGETACITWTQSRKLVRGKHELVTLNQYVLLQGRRVFFLTFAIKEDQAADQQSTFESIARAFRFLDK
jgi:hypothetical protein